ncbi:unnamed protein product, partial [Heterobilharzia americana]
YNLQKFSSCSYLSSVVSLQRSFYSTSKLLVQRRLFAVTLSNKRWLLASLSSFSEVTEYLFWPFPFHCLLVAISVTDGTSWMCNIIFTGAGIISSIYCF